MCDRCDRIEFVCSKCGIKICDKCLDSEVKDWIIDFNSEEMGMICPECWGKREVQHG